MGPILLLSLVLGIAFIVFATTRLRIHPFLALVITAYALGLCGGLSPEDTITALTAGFGKTVGYIGIVIACGCMIGAVLEKSGCALVMAQTILRLTGHQRSVLAMSCTGAVVSIPVFCDSGYVVLSSLTRSLARQTGVSLATFAIALSMGLYATHCLVPPTPGPIATAGELKADLGTVIVLGLIVVIPVVMATYAYARFAGRRVFIDPASQDRKAAPDARDSAPAPVERIQHGPLAAFLPILVPVLLIAVRSVADLPGRPLGDGAIRAAVGALGDPNTALVLGLLLTWVVARRHGLPAFGTWCGEGIRDAGTIILITAAGGALGAVLRATPTADLISHGLGSLELGPLNILVPFLLAAALKTAIGSSTVAMITSASLISQSLPALGLATGYGPALATLGISCGAMMVSHANDSFFWVVTQMSGMTVSQGYRLITAATAIAGLTGVAAVVALTLILN
jgi:gluconate:H+ symporter, GntP family